MRWERGDVSFLFIGHVKPSEALTVLDNKECLYQRVRYEVCVHVLKWLQVSVSLTFRYFS